MPYMYRSSYGGRHEEIKPDVKIHEHAVLDVIEY